MSFIKAKEQLTKYGLEDRIMEFPVSSATVSEAAVALHCKEAEIAKTMAFQLEENPILIVIAGDEKIDNSKFKMEFHTKAKMIPFSDVETIIGHIAGGVCPFGVLDGVKVYLDESLKRFDFVYPACGSRNSAVKLTIPELEESSQFVRWVNVCKEKE